MNGCCCTRCWCYPCRCCGCCGGYGWGVRTCPTCHGHGVIPTWYPPRPIRPQIIPHPPWWAQTTSAPLFHGNAQADAALARA